MATKLNSDDFEPEEFELHDAVTFTLEGKRVTGVVVRVYNSRDLYHVSVGNERYQVDPRNDRMERASTKA